jgi:hypothetical protein
MVKPQSSSSNPAKCNITHSSHIYKCRPPHQSRPLPLLGLPFLLSEEMTPCISTSTKEANIKSSNSSKHRGSQSSPRQKPTSSSLKSLSASKLKVSAEEPPWSSKIRRWPSLTQCPTSSSIQMHSTRTSTWKSQRKKKSYNSTIPGSPDKSVGSKLTVTRAEPISSWPTKSTPQKRLSETAMSSTLLHYQSTNSRSSKPTMHCSSSAATSRSLKPLSF